MATITLKQQFDVDLIDAQIEHITRKIFKSLHSALVAGTMHRTKLRQIRTALYQAKQAILLNIN